ncbi:PilZ domain-containing protein [Arenimonas oryziterrae]|uniref:PilZ domain-containing protein n=1 Tax=Arenimonas oryziterrae DSM 21050 = YC6267 TaxID=1121015 RepID=A0A091AYD5_9GAMM|nr:PilZ domain-containing protein [Arenimonas oryziterrae]KFN43669.1 hypothetical protein N789_10355 [Arenimonas oryziterrae DSM 21050 = YC6267]
MAAAEKREHPRENVFLAIMISPNGSEHRVVVYDLSESGARLGLADDWEAHAGTALRLYFQLDPEHVVMLNGRVTRLAVDHMGVQFAPVQADAIRQLLAGIGLGD